MAPRSKLSAVLNAIADHVYFQPKSDVTMEFPCIVYKRATENSDYANNEKYLRSQAYEVTVIDSDPDSVIREAVAALPQCRHITFFVANQRNHDVFNVF